MTKCDFEAFLGHLGVFFCSHFWIKDLCTLQVDEKELVAMYQDWIDDSPGKPEDDEAQDLEVMVMRTC